jgi:hypothetical protein
MKIEQDGIIYIEEEQKMYAPKGTAFSTLFLFNIMLENRGFVVNWMEFIGD